MVSNWFLLSNQYLFTEQCYFKHEKIIWIAYLVQYKDLAAAAVFLAKEFNIFVCTVQWSSSGPAFVRFLYNSFTMIPRKSAGERGVTFIMSCIHFGLAIIRKCLFRGIIDLTSKGVEKFSWNDSFSEVLIVGELK